MRDEVNVNVRKRARARGQPASSLEKNAQGENNHVSRSHSFFGAFIREAAKTDSTYTLCSPSRIKIMNVRDGVNVSVSLQYRARSTKMGARARARAAC